MEINNLAFLSDASEDSILGGNRKKGKKRPKYDYKFNKKVNIDVNADYDIDVDVHGFSSELTFDVLAVGYDGGATDGEFTAIADAYQGVSILKGNFFAAAEY